MCFCFHGVRTTGSYTYGHTRSRHDALPSWPRAQGFRVVQAEECWYKSLAPLMEEVRAQLGDGPVHLSFDIDGLDPSSAPGTGTPEIGGLTKIGRAHV